MKKGFTIIELMVVIAIGILIIGVGINRINEFLGKQEVAKVRSEVSNILKIARNLAVTSQRPASFTNDLAYVKLTIDQNGMVVATPFDNNNTGGDNYFSRDITPLGVSIPAAKEFIFCSPSGTAGKIVDNKVVPLGIGDTLSVVVESNSAQTNGAVVSVSQNGLIEEREYSIKVILPTSIPTPTPTPTPICFDNERDCCAYYCKKSTCNTKIDKKTGCYLLDSCNTGDDFYAN